MGKTLLDKGWELREEYTKLLAQRAANRRSLRDLATQDLLTHEEALEVDELYKPRQANEDEETGDAGGDE
jgi:hypothetical protein